MSRRGKDLVLYNGHVMTMDTARPEASAVAIRAGNVVAVGDDDAVRAAAGPGVDTIDLKGRTATPGLNDAHAHPMSVGLAMSDLDIGPESAGSIPAIVAKVRAQAERTPAGSWIVGRGYDQARLAEQRHPTRTDLDAISPDHPVVLIRACHHIAVANSVALQAAGIDKATRDPDGGAIDRDDAGRPTGVVRETAMTLVRAQIPRPTEQQLAEALILAGKAFLAAGVTSTVEAGIREPIEMHAYQSLWSRGRLPARTYLMMMIDETLDALATLGIKTGYGDPWLRIGPAKLFSDGSIGGRTARMRLPFEGEAENVGLWMEPPDVMRAKIVRAHALGFQVGIHAIGDAAIDVILDAYEEAQRLHPRPDARHRMEHCSIVDLETIRRIKRLGVIPIPGTSFLYHFRPAYEQNLGLERIRYAYAMRTFADEGVAAAASTDAPVVPVSAAVGIGMMMNRVDVTGTPVWPEERVGLDEAIRAYTWNGAYASFEEDIKGSLEHGKVGDVTVFDSDLREVSPTDMKDIEIDLTITDGQIAYARGGAWS